MHHRLTALSLSVLVQIAAAYAQSPDFLPVPQAIKGIMDGRSWNALTSDGMRAKLTLNKDGTGTFEGPVTISIDWEQQADAVCINLRMAGTKCLRFRAIKGGFEAYNGNKIDLTFTR
jgi:hypothetical protein